MEALYGVRCAANFNNQEKSRKTKFKIYGDESYNNRPKAKETTLERYGVDNGAKLEKNREKSRLASHSAEEIARQVYAKRGVDLDELPAKEQIIANYEIIVDPLRLKEFSFNLKSELKRKLYYADVQSRLGCSASLLSKYSSSEEWFLEIFTFGGSYLESLVFDFLSTVDFSNSTFEGSILFRRRDRKAIAPLELDFYLPRLRLGIEVQDFATHSRDSNCEAPEGVWLSRLEFKKGPLAHETKRIACERSGIMLLELWEDEVVDGSFEEKVRNALAHQWR